MTEEQTNKMWYIHEYYSALKMKEILTPATTWMNFEDIRLSGISQSQKDKHHCMIPLTEGTKRSQNNKDRKKNGSC
jgi:hypothetical protein